MWDKGYIKAYTTYYGEGVAIKKGDYFRVLYDNGQDYIYIEKTNGQAGWIYVTWNAYELNNHTLCLQVDEKHKQKQR